MKDFFYFVKGNFKKVSFGWLLTFFSSFGQTFLISLYVPEIIKTFDISEGTFGAIYAGCTTISSVLMLSIGHTVDHIPAKKVTAFTILGLAISSILFGLSYHLALLGVALVGLRLAGQGFLSHISMTVMSKVFVENRGKALSFSSLGYSLGEALFPLGISFIIAWFDWRIAAMTSGVFLLVYLIRLRYTDLSGFDKELSAEGKPSTIAFSRNTECDLPQKVFYHDAGELCDQFLGYGHFLLPIRFC